MGTLAKLAAAVALAAASTGLSVQPVGRGYATPKDCFYGSGAYLAPTVTACVDICDSACPQFLVDCAVLCAGGTPPPEMIRVVKAAAGELQAGVGNMSRNVAIIEIGRVHPDERVRIVASAIGAETPFVRIQ